MAARLGLGTVQFGLPYGISNGDGQVAASEARAILDVAAAAGIELVDTAAAYGNAEEVLAGMLGPGDMFRIVTKTLPLVKAGLAGTIARARQSASTLKDRIDTLMVHAAGDLATNEGARLWLAMQAMRAEGLVRRLGISAYAADEPLRLARQFRPDVMQVPVSLLDQRLVLDGTLDGLKRLGIEVHVRSLFLQGLIFLDPGQLPPRLAGASGRLAIVGEAIHQAGMTRLEAAVSYVMGLQTVDFAIVGVTRRAELEQIVTASGCAGAARLDWASCALDDPVVLTPSLW